MDKHHDHDGMDDHEHDDVSHEGEEKETVEMSSNFIISHQATLKQVWDLVDTVCSLVSGYVYAWIACFGLQSPHSD